MLIWTSQYEELAECDGSECVRSPRTLVLKMTDLRSEEDDKPRVAFKWKSGQGDAEARICIVSAGKRTDRVRWASGLGDGHLDPTKAEDGSPQMHVCSKSLSVIPLLSYSTDIPSNKAHQVPGIEQSIPALDMDSSRLSKNDSSVLSALFDPESSLSSTVRVEDNQTQDSDKGRTKQLQERERHALRLINHEAPTTTDIDLAVTELTALIDDEPIYASAWNNRAQARRMPLSDQALPQNPSAVAEILKDLAQAISLTTPTSTQLNGTVSSVDARVLASAHTHRGYLLLQASKCEANRAMLAAVPGLGGLSCEGLEDAASRELALGGRYGNDTARQLAVKTNPYAKLCGSIVREALTKEISDFYQPIRT